MDFEVSGALDRNGTRTKAYKDFKDPEKLTSEVRRLYRQWAASRPQPVEDESEDAEAANVVTTYEGS